MVKDGPPVIVQWICTICGISGITLIGIKKFFFPDLSQILIIGSFTIAIVTAIVGVVSAKKYQKQLSKKNVKLEELSKQLEVSSKQLEVSKKQLEELSKQLEVSNEQLEVLKKILISEKPAQAGYYMTNKTVYDNFKTNLEILKCNLDVSLVKDSEDYHLQFKWKLFVFNPNDHSVEKAKFIYSGDKNERTLPKVTFEKEPAVVTLKSEENVVGDDRFIEIDFPSALKSKSTADICIDYILPTYKFNPDYDFIWLVPDALGFTSMSEFCIRFFCDGEIVKDTTSSVLRSYILSGKYPQDDDKIIELKQLGEGRVGFECKEQDGYEKLRGHGFLLILINDRGKLPYYLQNIPTKNN